MSLKEKEMNCLNARMMLGLTMASMMVFSAAAAIPAARRTPSPTPMPQNGTVSVIVSDDSTDDWATIGARSLIDFADPAGRRHTCNGLRAPSPAPYINLLQLDQLGEILGNTTIPAGTYTAGDDYRQWQSGRRFADHFRRSGNWILRPRPAQRFPQARSRFSAPREVRAA